MSDSSTCSTSQTCTLQANLRTCEPCGTSCQQMAESPVKELRNVCFPQHNTFSRTPPNLSRRPSSDGSLSSGSGSGSGRGSIVDPDRFHPYRRPFRDAVCLQQSSPPFSCLQDGFSPDRSSQNSCSEASSAPPSSSWEQFNGSVQSSYSEAPAVPVEPTSFLCQGYQSYSSSTSLQQVSSRLYPNTDQSCSPKYSVQTLTTLAHRETTTEPVFPKPIYSYSILIFMALKSSKTGSLPVSEIYSFMTEHFPYFKTAPDGWKNSVRHNLSLNKCFEKVENKNGSSSRKGCLWALNPAKVGKMQEELHKWRRKDPLTVRRSMARPEDLDHLVGERQDKARPLPPYSSSSLISRLTPFYGNTPSSPRSPAQLRPSCQPARRSEYAHTLPRPPCYRPPTAAHPINSSFALCSPCGQPPSAAGLPSAPGGLNSPPAAKMPPTYDSALQADYSVGVRNMQGLLCEGDASYDLDTFTPSLTDLQLHGNLWEELRDDSLVSDPHVSTTTLSTYPALSESGVLPSCRSFIPLSRETSVTECEAESEGHLDTGCDQSPVQNGSYLNGLHPVAYSGVENLTGYLTSCTTFISLM